MAMAMASKGQNRDLVNSDAIATVMAGARLQPCQDNISEGQGGQYYNHSGARAGGPRRPHYDVNKPDKKTSILF